MVNVLVPNIFITTNYNYIKNYFLNKDNVASIDGLPEDRDTFLISSKTNKYLESLEHSFNYDNSDQGKLVLKFIDVDGKFEQKFLIQPINLFRTKLQQELQKERELFIGGGKNNQSESTIQQIYDEVASLDKIFIAYGIGNDLRNWSDPMIFNLYKMEVDVNEAGLRKYIFTFNVSNTVLFKPKLFLNTNSPNPEPEFNFANHIDNALVYLESTRDSSEFAESIVYGLLKKYVSQISNLSENNIIVILPEFENQFKEAAKFYTDWQSKKFEIAEIKESKNQKYYGTVTQPEDVFNYMFQFVMEDYFQIELHKLSNIISQFRDSRPTNLKPNTTAGNQSFAATMIELEKNSKNDKYYWTMASKPMPKNPLHPTFPDWFAPLNKISEALKSLLNSTDDLVVIEESNTKLLSLWKSFGLIQDEEKRCIIIGFNRLINEWLYRTNVNLPKDAWTSKLAPEDTWIKLLDKGFSPTFKLVSSKEKDKLEKRSSEYYTKYILTTTKRKNGSNFDEEIILDELVETLNQFNKEIIPITKASNLLKLLDIPIFINNLKNSNILSFNVDNSQTYLDMLRIAVRQDYDGFFLASVASNPDVININGKKPFLFIEELKKLLTTATDPLTGISNRELQNKGLKALGLTNSTYTTDNWTEDNFYYLMNKEFRIKLREVLMQQFAFLTEAGHNLNNIGRDKLEQELENATIPDRAQIGTQPAAYDSVIDMARGLFGEKDVGMHPDPAGFFKMPIYESSEDRNKRIMKKYGLSKLYTEDEVKQILKRSRLIIKLFDKILIQSKGETNISNLLLGVAVMRTENYFPIELEEQLRILNHALLLSYIYNVDILNEDITREKVITITPKRFSIPQTAMLGELLKFASRQMYKISLKTLPFFHLSNFREMNLKPCFIFSRKMYAMKSNRNENLIDYDFFNGAYNITGFKHTITTKDAYSQFLLQKITVGSADT